MSTLIIIISDNGSPVPIQLKGHFNSTKYIEVLNSYSICELV